MQVSRDVGEPICKAFESCLQPVKNRPGVYKAYRCPANVITIGWGTTAADGYPLKDDTLWSQQQCDDAFTRAGPKYGAHVDKMLQGAEVTQAQYDALWDWSYNTGGPATSAVWTYVRKGDVDGVCLRLERWNKGGGKVLPGLVRRRKSECALYRGDIDEASRIAQTHRATGEVMAQRVDKPTPPAAEVAKRAPMATASMGTGTVGSSAGGAAKTQAPETQAPPAKIATEQPSKPVDTSMPWADVAFFGGIALVAIGAAFFARKYFQLDKDWA